MVKRLQNRGFSLAEVMMAAGILAIGFVFIAGVFPVGIKLTVIATEQTIAPIVADEAFAKIRLYADPNFVVSLNSAQSQSATEYINLADVLYIPDNEFGYPSTDISPERKQYHWSALCGLLLSGDVHVTVFATRISGAGTRFPTHESNYILSYGQADTNVLGNRPVPVRVVVTASGTPGEERILTISSSVDETYINADSTIVDDATWQIYRVLGRGMNGDPENVITLDRDWRDWQEPLGDFVWVVPPAVGSGRYPGIGIYQRIVSF
jgi:prepilin-type N-terminal cleavage/methylation domain-containing protein